MTVTRSDSRIVFVLFGAVLLTACAVSSDDPRDAFFENLSALCGGTYSGQVISDQAVDADWIASALTVGPVACDADEIRMPLAVGDDRSRTWVVTQREDELEFRHEHTDPDGSPSAVTEYGGFSRDGGTATMQAFPADDLTKANFTENSIAVSNANVWTFKMADGTLLYSLARPATETNPARDFRAEFDIKTPLTRQNARVSPSYRYSLRDAERFAALFTATNGAPSARQLQSDYIDGAERGIEIFTPDRIRSAENLTDAITANPDAYRRAIDVCLPAARNAGASLDAIYARLAELFPGRGLPDVYAVFGAMNSGGTANSEAQVLGLEVICETNQTREEIDAAFRFFFAHETVHAFQPEYDWEIGRVDPLLYHVLLEGFADYVAYRVTGAVPNETRNAWALEHEEQIWADFKDDRALILQSFEDGSSTANVWSDAAVQAHRRWVGNYGNAPDGWPHELGYWVGRMIITDFIENSDDRDAAFNAALALDDTLTLWKTSQKR